MHFVFCRFLPAYTYTSSRARIFYDLEVISYSLPGGQNACSARASSL